MGMGGNICLVIGAFSNPSICDGKLHRGICIRFDRNPFIRMNSGTIVDIWTNIDRFNADFRKPVAQAAGLLPRPAPGCGFRVAAPEQEQIGMIGNIFPEVGLCPLSHGILPPNMFGTPIPTFPAVRVTGLYRIAAQQFQQSGLTAMRTMYGFCFAMAIRLGQNGTRPIGTLNPFSVLWRLIQQLHPRRCARTG